MSNQEYAATITKRTEPLIAAFGLPELTYRLPQIVWGGFVAYGDDAASFLDEAEDAASKFNITPAEWLVYFLDSAGVDPTLDEVLV